MRLPMSLLAVLTAVTLAACGGGDDNATSSGDNATSSGDKVKVIIAGTNDALEEVTDGGITGEGTFRATGAIKDHGTVRGYRAIGVLNPNLILLRFVTKGQKGAITYLVKIDIKARPVISRWTIESGTKAYKGLHGEGTETENARFTVSTLRGTVWR